MSLHRTINHLTSLLKKTSKKERELCEHNETLRRKVTSCELSQALAESQLQITQTDLQQVKESYRELQVEHASLDSGNYDIELCV